VYLSDGLSPGVRRIGGLAEAIPAGDFPFS